MSWGKVGREIVEQMGEKNADYKSLALDAIAKICETYPDSPESRKNALASINREILKKYPRQREEKSNYYHDPKGKESLPKWRHNIFQWLTLEQKDWDKLHEGAKETESDTTPITDDVAEVVSTTNLNSTLTLDFRVERLNPEVKEMAIATMQAQGINWLELIEKSLNQYCKGYINRTRAMADEISEIETDRLLNDPALRTHPERAKELTKRAIIAIKKHNDNQPENDTRWLISASIIGQLIKSKTTTVNQCLQEFKDDIESHNAKFEFGMMHNRGKGDISDFVDLVELCPTGE